jgi:hypothetical protein
MGRDMRNRFARAALGAAATVALLVLSCVFAGPAEAAVGGCNPHLKAAGFDVGACISNRGSANPTYVYPDIYVNNVPAGPNSCTIYVELWHGNQKVFTDAGHSCSKGHDDATDKNGNIVHTQVPGCLYLHASTQMTLNGQFVRIGDSPTYKFGDGC